MWILGSVLTSKVTHLGQESNNVNVRIVAENEFWKYVHVGIWAQNAWSLLHELHVKIKAFCLHREKLRSVETQQVPPKRRHPSTYVHEVTSLKTLNLMLNAVKVKVNA